MEQNLILYTIIGMSLVTLLIKVIPAILISNLKIPDSINKVLEFIPIAVLSSMVIQFLIIKNGELNITFSNEYIWAGLLTIFIAFIFKSLFITIIAGIFSIILIRYSGIIQIFF